MINSTNMHKVTKIVLLAQLIIFISTILIGSLNNAENGFNGMQAIFVIPIFFIIFVSYLIWKYLATKFNSDHNYKAVKLTNGVFVFFLFIALIVDLGILASAFLTDFYINIFSFPPTVNKY